MNTPILSIGIIFKNDIRCIERCLSSLEPLRKALPCQLVMADTGSADGGRAVAERYADILIDFPWVDDFAAARNAVLDRCTGEWYLTVDTDEWLDPQFGELIDFLNSGKSREFDECSVIQRNYQDAQFRDYGDFFAPRMARRQNGQLRYKGAIHEVFVYPGQGSPKSHALGGVILHHDGYIDVTPEHRMKKNQRNMELLEKALAKDPENIRLLVECIDSSRDPEEESLYAERTHDLLRREEGNCPLVRYSIAYHRCLLAYGRSRDLDKVLACYQEWKVYSPQSALLRMDGEALAASAAYQKDKFEEALAHIENYWLAQKEKASGADLRRSDRLHSQYHTDNHSWRSNLKAMEFSCLRNLERFEEADMLLDKVVLEELLLKDRGFMVMEVLKQPERLRQSADFLRRNWDFFLDEAAWRETGEEDSRQIAMGDFIKMLLNYLSRVGRDGWTILEQMGDCAPGRSARIVLSDDAGAIAREWAHVADWERMFPQAYLHTMELRLPLPEGFYRQNSEQMSALAAALAKQPSLPRTTLDWLEHIDPPATPGQLAWQLDLAIAALRAHGWTDDVPVGQGLCAHYAALSATWLDNVYNPELLNAEDVAVLPGMHRFAWHLRQALAAWEKGDELGYVRSLRTALDAAPAMKETVDFLLEHKPRTAAQRQLEELAGQVRAILARYAPDDPAVQAIKASPAYQKVAHLLTQQETPAAAPQALNEPLVSSSALEEALAGSREDIEASIRKSMGRWGREIQNVRTEYWEKYPLWGKNEAEVTANLTAALAGHSGDFLWLFHRLGDEQSRRVLTAVVRNWRFYEKEQLEQVIDQKNDDYFDRALLHCDENEVVADLGAYVGDTFLAYVKNYGSMAYRRYYCYEITKESFDALSMVTAAYPRVELRRKGAGDAPGVMSLAAGADASANVLTSAGRAEGETVDVVPLDQDITEPLTLIKMDIEGAEQAALRGCARHIRQDRPKLALSVYHNFEDLWKLPRMIDEMAPGYRFYLRYHGGALWPSEITLLALPQEQNIEGD